VIGPRDTPCHYDDASRTNGQSTVKTAVLLVILPEVAVMSVVPVPCAVAKPLLSIVATLVSDDFQVTAFVMSTVVPSSSVAIAVNCFVPLEVIEALVGLIAIERKFATVTVTLVEPLIVTEVAVTLIVPYETPDSKPLFDTVATEVSSEDQLTEPVMTFVLPSLYVPVAVICLVLSTVTDGVTGVTVMLVSVGSTKNPLQLVKAKISNVVQASNGNNRLSEPLMENPRDVASYLNCV
jgi:hypothetical protein